LKPRLRRELSRAVAAAGVEGVDHADVHARVELFGQLADGPGCGFEEQLQERAVGVEEGPEEVVDGEGDVKVGHVVEIAGDVGNPVIDARILRVDLAAGGTEAGLAGEGDATVEAAAGADVAGFVVSSAERRSRHWGRGRGSCAPRSCGRRRVGLMGSRLREADRTKHASGRGRCDGSGRGRWDGRGCARRV
jgi:hypothetical protein